MQICKWLWMMIAAPLLGQMQTTPNIGLTIPPSDHPSYRDINNANMTKIDNAIAAFQPYQGQWKSTTSYPPGVMVHYGATNTLYLSLIPNNQNHQPDTSPQAWMAMSSGGSSAPAGFANLPSQSGKGAQAKLNSWIAAQTAAGKRGVLWIDPGVEGGAPTSPLSSSTRVFDARGTNCMDQFGGFSFADNSFCVYAREDQQDPNNATYYRTDFNLGYESAKGGIYSSTSNGHGYKSKRNILTMFGTFRTSAEHYGILQTLTGLGGGEVDSFATSVENYSGYIGYGQEAHTAFRAGQYSGARNDGLGGVFKGTITGISGNTVRFSTTSDQAAYTLGEDRFIRDLGNSYSTGTISNVTCSSSSPTTCTVTGSGTAWTSITGFVGTHTTWTESLSVGGPILTNNLVLCFAPNSSGGFGSGSTGHDWCVPITQGLTNTTLTVNLYNVSTAQNTPWYGPTSGNYTIYHAAYPTAVNAVSGNYSFTAGDVSGLTNGHNFDQVAAYNQQLQGGLILQSRDIGMPYFGGGWNVIDYSPAGAPAFGAGFEVEGNYLTALRMDAYGGHAPSSLAYISQRGEGAVINDSSPGTTTSFNFYTYRESDGKTRVPISFTPDTSSRSRGMCIYGAWCFNPLGGVSNAATGIQLLPDGTVAAPSMKASGYLTANNCSSTASPAVCSAASAGSVAVAAGTTTVVVNTTAVTANSEIFLTFDSSLGSKLRATCNTSFVNGWVSARIAGTSFAITVSTPPTTNPACFSYHIMN